jgi:hypothetical protein
MTDRPAENLLSELAPQVLGVLDSPRSWLVTVAGRRIGVVLHMLYLTCCHT